MRLYSAVARFLNVDNSAARKIINDGDVYLNHVVCADAEKDLSSGDSVTIVGYRGKYIVPRAKRS